MEAMTTPSSSVERNQTNERIDDPKKKKDDGIGIEITITLTIGLLLFIINGAAFLNLAWKKRIAQKQFRRNLEVTRTELLIVFLFHVLGSNTSAD